ncbi:carboxymuconolactone decarboxylase family protein [Aquimarina sp. U1-2]|uniref:carboxymuconolactone decarboxylase family protein n=1 Tax=Aquimarina sp. U1-2 TaxID=2823141 RepID=UPI001AECD898|nr:carboxymuconolactone decarboxylase family protein [Aquimarina sp. U1-2]MBP2831897.1 carboxymuconolactone decarboxylase family protein [Aquimarina sp. U1-2]
MKTISSIIEDPITTEELENTFNTIKKELGAPFVPNFFQVWGHAPLALHGIVPAMKYILGSGVLNRKVKEMIMIAISSSKNCNYCETAHQVFCFAMGALPEQIECLVNEHTLSASDDPKDKAAIDFAVRLSRDPNSSSEADFEKLQKLGYSKPEILEIIAMSGMAVFYSHLAAATKINIDEGFAEALSKTEVK